MTTAKRTPRQLALLHLQQALLLLDSSGDGILAAHVCFGVELLAAQLKADPQPYDVMAWETGSAHHVH